MTDPAPTAPPPSALHAHYTALLAECGANLKAAMAVDGGNLQARSHAFSADLGVWHSVLASRRESVLVEAAAREYQYALLAVALGQYRHAFAALRLFMELSVAAVYYSAHELQLRRWLEGARDNNWRRFTASSTGIASDTFAEAFFPTLRSEVKQYGAILTKAYRECSEYVHGNMAATRTLPNILSFDETVFRAWHERADAARLAVSFFLALRYLHDFNAAQLAQIEATTSEYLGHLPQVRARVQSDATI